MKKMMQPMLALALTLFSLHVFAEDDVKTQKIKASYVLAFGRTPDAAELKYWQGQPEQSMGQLMDKHKAYIASGYQDFVITRSYVDAMGRFPSEDEKKYWRSYNQTYTDLMKNHVKWLGGGNAEYEKVIKRAFGYVAGRMPSADELKAWKNKDTKSYAILVGLLQDSKKQADKSGSRTLMGIEDWLSAASTALSFVVVSTPVLNDIVKLIGNDAGSLVAAGAGNISIRMDVISPNGASVIGQNGASIVAAGAGNVIVNNGGNIVGNAGGN